MQRAWHVLLCSTRRPCICTAPLLSTASPPPSTASVCGTSQPGRLCLAPVRAACVRALLPQPCAHACIPLVLPTRPLPQALPAALAPLGSACLGHRSSSLCRPFCHLVLAVLRGKPAARGAAGARGGRQGAAQRHAARQGGMTARLAARAWCELCLLLCRPDCCVVDRTVMPTCTRGHC